MEYYDLAWSLCCGLALDRRCLEIYGVVLKQSSLCEEQDSDTVEHDNAKEELKLQAGLKMDYFLSFLNAILQEPLLMSEIVPRNDIPSPLALGLLFLHKAADPTRIYRSLSALLAMNVHYYQCQLLI